MAMAAAAARRIPLAVALLVAALGCERSEPPAHLSRLRDMRRAAPPTWDASKLGLCPQSPDAEAIAAAPPGSGAPAGIVCSLSLHDYTDTALFKIRPSDALADMNVIAWLGTDTGPYFFAVSGPEDRNEMSMVFPVTGLQRSDRLVIHVLERNFSGTEGIDGLKATLDGPPPFSFMGNRGRAELECREFDEATRDRFLAPREEEARRLFAEFARFRPDPRVQGFAWPSKHDDKTEKGLHAVVALLGWDHPRAKGWVDEYLAARAARAAAFAGVFTAERAASGVAALGNGLVIRGRRVEDDIQLDLLNQSSEAVSLYSIQSIYVFGADGARDEHRTSLDSISLLEPGKVARLRYERSDSRPQGDGAIVRPPFLVRGSLKTTSAPLGTPLRVAGHLTLTARAGCGSEKDAIACGAAVNPVELRGGGPSRCRCVIVELRNTGAAPMNIEDQKRIFHVSFRARSTSEALGSRLETSTASAIPVLSPGSAVEEVYVLDEPELAPDQLMLDLSDRTFDGWLPWSLAID